MHVVLRMSGRVRFELKTGTYIILCIKLNAQKIFMSLAHSGPNDLLMQMRHKFEKLLKKKNRKKCVMTFFVAPKHWVLETVDRNDRFHI